MKRGYFGIGCINMKTDLNYGTLFRTAQVFEADFLFLIGRRFKKMASDTGKSFKHIPVFEYQTFEDFRAHIPFNCRIVAVETEGLMMLADFVHPENACYLLGAEDHGIPKEVLEKCHQIVRLPGERSLNVAVAGSIVIYDRITK
jgi:tRNA G18 (ribose-2'-O)-methylase SpoU